MILLVPADVAALRVMAADPDWHLTKVWKERGIVPWRLPILSSLGVAERSPGWPSRYRITVAGLARLDQETA